MESSQQALTRLQKPIPQSLQANKPNLLTNPQKNELQRAPIPIILLN